MIPKFEFARLPLSVPRWWPLVTKSRHDASIERAQNLVDAEYARAYVDGAARVHRWAVEANYNVSIHPVPRAAASAAFQEAEHQFATCPTQLQEVL